MPRWSATAQATASDHAGELDERAVARGLDHASMMRGDGRIKELAAVRFQRLQGADFIGLHQPAVTDDIGGEDSRKPAVNGLIDHDLPLLPTGQRTNFVLVWRFRSPRHSLQRVRDADF
jgi:hypothetical protein